jgi:hypothetical protein
MTTLIETNNRDEHNEVVELNTSSDFNMVTTSSNFIETSLMALSTNNTSCIHTISHDSGCPNDENMSLIENKKSSSINNNKDSCNVKVAIRFILIFLFAYN